MASRDLRVTLIGEDRTGGAFGSASKNADGMGSKFAALGRMAGVALAGMGVAAGVFAKSGVDAFARVEDATGAAGVIFGESSKQITTFAKSASSNFGMAQGAAIDAANTFGTLGKSAGLSGDDLADFSTDFTALAGDMASFRGTSPEQAIEAIGAALRGETEPIRAYGVLLDDASMRQEALAMGLIKTTKEALTPQQKVLAAQSLIYKQTADAQGDFARTSDSTANTAKRLAAETENASARLGEQLAPAVTMAREAFLGLIKGASGLVEMIGPAIGRLREAFVSIGSTIMSVVGWFKQHDTAALALGVVVGTVATLVTAAWVAQATVATVNAAKSVAAWFATATASTTSATIQSRSTAQIVVGWLAASAAAAANAARVVAGWVLMGATALIQGARMAAGWLLAMGPVGWVIAAVVGLVALIVANWDKVKNFTASAWSAISGFVVGEWRKLTGTIAAGVENVVGFFRGLPGRILGAMQGLGTLLLNAGADMVQGFIRGIGNMAQKAAQAAIDVAKKAVNGLKNFLGISSPSKVFAGLGKNVGEGFVNGIAGMRPAVAAEMQRLADTQALTSGPLGFGVRTASAMAPMGGARLAPMAGAAAARPDSRPMVNIEQYNEARQSPQQVAQDLSFLARTGG